MLHIAGIQHSTTLCEVTMLMLSGQITDEHPSMTTLSLVSLIPQIGLLALALAAMLSLVNAVDDDADSSEKKNQYAGQIILLAFGWFWSSQVLKKRIFGGNV